MPTFSSLTIASLLAGALLSSCSHPSATTDSASTSKPEAPVATGTRMSRADSLNGIPGHHFGDQVSTFPGMILAKGQEAGTQTYTYPKDKPEGGWFGKHKKGGNLFVFYTFKDNKFVGVQALAFGTTRAELQEETLFLLGPGQKGVLNTSWAGKKTQAFYTPQMLPKGPAEILDIQSLSLVEAQAKESTDRLKRENTGQ